jgi:Na+/H+ antiporter NhaC
MEQMLEGFKSLLGAMVILISAWSLAQLTAELHTADFLSEILVGSFPVSGMPVLTFVLAGAIAFSTGSSWSTMAILFPIVLPTTFSMAEMAAWPEPEWMELLYHVIASVMAGAVLGDHCSPISDTTILSSLSSSCDHLYHVRTQMPYALTVGAISVLAGGLAYALGVPWWLSYLAGFLLIWLVVEKVGKSVG